MFDHSMLATFTRRAKYSFESFRTSIQRLRPGLRIGTRLGGPYLKGRRFTMLRAREDTIGDGLPSNMSQSSTRKGTWMGTSDAHRSVLHSLLDSFQYVLEFFIHLLLPLSVSSLLLPVRDHFAAHPDTRFEGYYTRIQTTDGSTVVVIFSTVPNAKNGTDSFLHFSMTPSSTCSPAMKPMKMDLYPKMMKYRNLGPPSSEGKQSFQMEAGNDGVTLGTFTVRDDTQSYRLRLPACSSDGNGSALTRDKKKIVHVTIDVASRTPLNPNQIHQVPHESVVRLGSLFPLHWHVHSTASKATFVVREDDEQPPAPK